MTDNFHQLAAAALDFCAALASAPDGAEQACCDLARAALTFAAASQPEGQDDYSDCAAG